MNYEEALRLWGYKKLEDSLYKTESVENIDVRMNFNQGFNCCGGRDPECYCSMAESPSAEVIISGHTSRNRYVQHKIELEDFDFVKILGEIIEAGGGSINDKDHE